MMQTVFASLSLPLTVTDVVTPVLTESVLWLLAAAVGIFFYGYLIDYSIFENRGGVRSERFEHWDALLASALVGFFLFIMLYAQYASDSKGPPAIATAEVLIANTTIVAMLFLLLNTAIIAVLGLRQISLPETFGFTKLGPLKILVLAAGLLALAYPLIFLSGIVFQLLLSAGGHPDESNQELVNFFIHSNSTTAKWVVALTAVVSAPLQEEFLFRGYIYGVAKRYGGVIFGVLVNASMFALIHDHLPSFVPLFVLAVCLTLAYEWTGCLWVNIGMHALFNSTTLFMLLTGRDS